MQPKTAVVIGAGDRGMRAYAPYALEFPHELTIVGVAEPDKKRQEAFQENFLLEDKVCFSSWQEMMEQGKLADIAIVCTMDRYHFAPTVKALETGYHVLLEKPMSPDPEECMAIERMARKHQRKLSVCHVLRYTAFWSAIKQQISEGKIGDVASLQLNENVEIMHMAHSFVRGNWNNKEKSSPMILQKSCHDMDIIQYVLGKTCERISSYGSLMHFREENAPDGAPDRCLDGCPVEMDCPFHAGRYYLGEGKDWAKKITLDTSREGIISALHHTDYGRCVYRSDNNVVDHQVVNMEFAGGATATFSMCGFTREQTRMVQIMGTKGEIRGNMEDNRISVYDFLTKQETVIHLGSSTGKHGGGDQGIIRSFLHELDHPDMERDVSSAQESLHSHVMAFAAEESRLQKGKSIELNRFYQSFV